MKGRQNGLKAGGEAACRQGAYKEELGAGSHLISVKQAGEKPHNFIVHLVSLHISLLICFDDEATLTGTVDELHTSSGNSAKVGWKRAFPGRQASALQWVQFFVCGASIGITASNSERRAGRPLLIR